jgi:hypothetical protein
VSHGPASLGKLLGESARFSAGVAPTVAHTEFPQEFDCGIVADEIGDGLGVEAVGDVDDGFANELVAWLAHHLSLMQVKLLMPDPIPETLRRHPQRHSATTFTLGPERTICTASRRHSGGYGGRLLGITNILSQTHHESSQLIYQTGGVPLTTRRTAGRRQLLRQTVESRSN